MTQIYSLFSHANIVKKKFRKYVNKLTPQNIDDNVHTTNLETYHATHMRKLIIAPVINIISIIMIVIKITKQSHIGLLLTSSLTIPVQPMVMTSGTTASSITTDPIIVHLRFTLRLPPQQKLAEQLQGSTYTRGDQRGRRYIRQFL